MAKIRVVDTPTLDKNPPGGKVHYIEKADSGRLPTEIGRDEPTAKPRTGKTAASRKSPAKRKALPKRKTVTKRQDGVAQDSRKEAAGDLSAPRRWHEPRNSSRC